jgi:hypothetical protein
MNFFAFSDLLIYVAGVIKWTLFALIHICLELRNRILANRDLRSTTQSAFQPCQSVF